MALKGGADRVAGALPRFSAATRLMVVAPHPDDETIACGVLVQQVVAAGGSVQVLLLTAGDNNPWPQRWLERRWHVGPMERQRWGLKRQAELHEALQHLGLSAGSLRLMGWPDLGVTARLLSPPAEAALRVDPVAEMAEAIARFSPSLLVFPGLDDRHPDHSAAHVLVQLALAGWAEQIPQQLGYLIHSKTTVEGAHEVIGTATQRREKMAALECYHSQMALSAQRLRRLATRVERYVDVSSEVSSHRRRNALPWNPSWWLRRWLRLTVISRSAVVSWRWNAAPLERDSQGGYGLDARAAAFTGRRFAKLTCDLPLLWIFDLWGWHEL